MGLVTYLRGEVRPRKVFYGWWIVLSCAAMQMIGSGAFYYGLGTFFLPLTQEFGWSRALTSSIFSLHRLEGGVIAPIVGFLFDRLGPRKLMTTGVSLLGAGFVIFSQVSTIPGFVVAVLVMSAGFSAGFASVGMATVANWFIRKRTTALGLQMTGSGASGLMVPALATLIVLYGWRTAALAIGILMLAVGLPLAQVMRHRPEPYGLLPDGDRPVGPLEEGSVGPGWRRRVATDGESDFGVQQALRSRVFWLLAVASSFTFVAQSAIVVHTIPYLDGVGVPSTLAASVVAAMTLVSIIGRIGFGWAGDRFDKRYVLAILYVLQMAGLAVFASVSSPWHVIPFLVLYGPSYGGAIPLRPSVQAEYFGRRSFGAIQGLMMGCSSIAGMIGPVFAGWMFDVFGSYRLAFWVLVAVAGFAIPAVLALPRPGAARRGLIADRE